MDTVIHIWVTWDTYIGYRDDIGIQGYITYMGYRAI